MINSNPLVSIGIPTRNRVRLLERAIASLLAQDYSNIEIVISDNNSSDQTPEYCESLSASYDNITVHHTENMIPPFQNFNKVLQLSKGKYFMWASDDDLWANDFVSSLVTILESESSLMLAAGETQYILTDGTKLPYFPEGKPLYKGVYGTRLQRCIMMAKHNYGDLLHGIYRRESLFTVKNKSVMDDLKHVNEIPVFLNVACKGSIKVIDRILFYKTVDISQYYQIAMKKGIIINNYSLTSNISIYDSHSMASKVKIYIVNSIGITCYHLKTFSDIRKAISNTECIPFERIVLISIFSVILLAHCLKLIMFREVHLLLTR